MIQNDLENIKIYELNAYIGLIRQFIHCRHLNFYHFSILVGPSFSFFYLTLLFGLAALVFFQLEVVSTFIA